jgi:hypothetical protein
MKSVQNKEIIKTTFLTCVNDEWFKKDEMDIKQILETLKICENDKIKLIDCPLHYQLVGYSLYNNIFPNCVAKPSEEIPELETGTIDTIEKDNLNQIMKKIPPPKKQNSKTCAIKDYETIRKEFDDKTLLYERDLKKALAVCFKEERKTALDVFNMMKSCVFKELHVLWKCYQ